MKRVVLWPILKSTTKLAKTSLIETQRSEFNSSINEEGMDKFLENLKKRIDSLRLENGKPSAKNSKKSSKQ